MNKFLSITGNLLSILTLLAFMGYIGLNTAYDLSTIAQDENDSMFRSFRDMLLVPTFVVGLLGLTLSSVYVAKNRDELTAMEMLLPLLIPALSLGGLALFAFVL